MKNSMSLSELVNAEAELLQYKREYYAGNPSVSDAEYDELERRVRKYHPNSLALSRPEFDPQIDVDLPCYVGSLDKLYAEDWDKIGRYRLGSNVDLHPKFDGHALVAHWSAECRLVGLYTRDGLVGKDKTYLAAALGVPLYNEDAYIAGQETVLVLEMIMPISVFEAKYAKDYANPRNALGAIMSAKEISPMVADVHLIGHHYVLPVGAPMTKAIGAIRAAMPMVTGLDANALTMERLTNELALCREALDYEIDGLVIKPNGKEHYNFSANSDPDFMVAFKVNTQFSEAIVTGCQWEPTAFGRIFPTLTIEPVVLGGTKITNVTAHHAQFVYANKIGAGTRIMLTRGGDVIPKIDRVIEANGDLLEAPAFLDPVWDGVHLKIGSRAEGTIDSVKIRRIYHFFKVVGIEGVAESLIERMFFAGMDTLHKVLTSTARDFMGLRNVKVKSATNMHAAIRDGITKATPAKLMVASALFPGIGMRLMTKILDAAFAGDVPKASQSDVELFQAVNAVPGVGPEFAKVFANGIRPFFQFQEELREVVKVQAVKKAEPVVATGKMAGSIFLFTDFRDSTMERAIQAAGGLVVEGFSKKVTHVVAPSHDTNTGKAQKARSAGIPVITPDELQAMLDAAV